MEEVKTLNEQKKEYLRKYQESVRRVTRIEEELKEIRAMKMSVSGGNNDGMPRGSGKGDLSAYVANLDEMERDLIEERYHRIMLYKDIARRIKRLISNKEKDVLFYRYIKGMEWYEIAEKMNFTERHIHRIHGKALLHFSIPERKDVSECQ